MPEKIEPLKPEDVAKMFREVCPKCGRSVLVKVRQVETENEDGSIKIKMEHLLRPHRPGKAHPGFPGARRQARKDAICC
jgi:hypothetical protein